MSQYAFPLEDTDYLAEQAQLWFSARTSGVYSSNNDLPVTSVGGMRIAVGAGMAWLDWERFKGIVYANTDTVNFDLALADGALDRIDRVVVRYNIIVNAVALAVKQGAFSTNPVAPALQRDASAYEIALADIRINRGTVEITQADIYDQRLNEAICGVMRDGVTGIPTAQLQAQWEAWLAKIADIPLDETLADWLVARMLVVEENKMDKPTGTTNQILDGTGTPKAPVDIPTLRPALTKRLIATFAGSGMFNIADFGLKLGDEIDAYEVSGGAGGSGGGAGGGGGFCKLLRDLTLLQDSYGIAVGAGGSTNQAGGATTAFGVTVNGGLPGTTANGGDGGSGGGVRGDANGNGGEGGWGGRNGGNNYTTTRSAIGGIGGGDVDYDPINPYDGRPYGCGGGGGINVNASPYRHGGNGGGPNGGVGRSGGAGYKGGLGSGGGGVASATSSDRGGDGGVGGGGGGGAPNNGGTGGGGLVYIYAHTDIPDTFETTWATANNYLVNIPLPTVPVEGSAFFIRFHEANTNATVNLNVNGRGNIRIYVGATGTTSPTVGQITAGSRHLVAYIGGVYRILTL